MGLDIGAIRDKYIDDLLPTDSRYSVVEIDTMKPPSDPDCATKYYETDKDLSEITVPPGMGSIWLAYDADGEAYSLPYDPTDPEDG